MSLDLTPLTQHQREGIEWASGLAHGGLLADEPGLGKSRTAIETYDGSRVLVVAPSMVITGGTWDDELERWAKYPDRFDIAPYTMLNARNERNSPNFGSTKYPEYRLRPEYLARDYDALIVDEAHYVKGRGTSWTWAVEELGKRADSVLLLTGTPMPNWAHELFMLCRIIDPAEAKKGRQFGSYWRWVYEWFQVMPSVHGSEHAKDIGGLIGCGSRLKCAARPANDPCEHWIEFAQANLGDRYLRRLRSDVLDLPELTEQTIQTPMDDSQRRMYKELKKEYITETDSGEEVVAWTDGAKNVLLDRITTSSWFLDKEGEPRGGKLERLRFDLQNRSQPTLVFAHYQDSVEAAARVAESTGARTAYVHGKVPKKVASAAVADFKAGNLDVLVGSLETLAEGLTLTQADMLIFLEKSFKPSRNEQALRRVHRLGQTRPVTALDYVTPASVDANKRHLLAEKTDQQMRALTAADFARLL